MVFPYTDHAPPAAINDTIGIAKIYLRGDWPWLRPRSLVVEALVAEVREVNRTVGDYE
jgi:hypothetical protein